MLLTLSTSHQPATDLGFVLHKHPDRFQSIDLAIGKGHIFYPESTAERTTIALLLDIDPIDMVRGSKHLSKNFSLAQYVNDRPYVSSSFMSVALNKAFSTAMGGTCKSRPELVDTAMPVEVNIAVIAAPSGGELLIRRLFEPLGYEVMLKRHPLDEELGWEASKYFTLQLKHEITIQQLLRHLYVLLPALDKDKHYFVSQSEIEKLLRKGKGWLEQHPEKEQITRRYLINLGGLTRQALSRLEPENETEPLNKKEGLAEKERKIGLHRQRLTAALEEIKATQAVSVLDLGCGEGKLLKMLLQEKQFTRIAGMDVSYSELIRAQKNLYWENMAPKQKERISLFQGSLMYRDNRLKGYDAAAIVEVIEHLDENRLKAFERVIFEFARPKTVVLTTPNSEYNILFETMAAGSMRHTDHRFEWTRDEFEQWANQIAEKFDYHVRFLPIGEIHEMYGAPSQMAIFTHGN